MRKVADYGLAVGIPIHSHIALNYVLADYIPKASQGTCVAAVGRRCNAHRLQVLHGGACWGFRPSRVQGCCGSMLLVQVLCRLSKTCGSKCNGAVTCAWRMP